ncbi:MAG: Type 1 glutamine amidotransferase-like domain-containing protein [Bacilli bacterium]|nr:Type 1 glutamine amidotransferase-like domain-containing protein [Bacilli bacterium]
MYKKIVAIGGGEIGKVKKDKTRSNYETKEQDEKIIELTGKEKPNFLFIGHAEPIEHQKSYYKTMRDIYNKMYGCPYKTIRSSDLENTEKVKELIDWADIIYEGGGNTKRMLELWNDTGFNIILKEALMKLKVLCGISAGASCWFSECLTDSLRLENENAPLIIIPGLNFVDGVFVPHANEEKKKIIKKYLKNTNKYAYLVSDCAALLINNDKIEVVKSRNDAYCIKVYWKNNKFYEEEL